jgi:hypothetical protein
MKKKRVRDKFLEELRKVPIVIVACQNCGISRNTVYRWRHEDPVFMESMEEALTEGENSIHDLAHSKLVGLINKSNLPAIRFWLNNRHPLYKQSSRATVHEDIIEEEIERIQQEKIDEVLKELRLTDVDFEDDKIEETKKRIDDYYKSK